MSSILSPHFSQMTNKRSFLFEELIIKSWWVILFFLVSFFAYDQAGRSRAREEGKLLKKYQQIILDKEEAFALQEELKREIASQNDSAWIELVLMKKLGLVPEGQTKVHFVHRSP